MPNSFFESPNSPNPSPEEAFRPGTPPGRFTRVIDLHGKEGFQRIQSAAVTVVGLGGVGSHATLALARTGVGRLVLVDHDRLTASSLNRFPAAGPSDVGRPKVEVAGDVWRCITTIERHYRR